MNEIVWMFPILFIIHDMEEIIGLGIWLNSNRKMLEKKCPSMLKTYSNFSIEGMAVAVSEELIICIAFCVVAIFTGNKYAYLLWLGGFFAYTLHLVIHIIQRIFFGKYIPSFATSIVLLPISVYVLHLSAIKMSNSVVELILFSMIGVVIVGVNLKFAQWLIDCFTTWMNKK